MLQEGIIWASPFSVGSSDSQLSFVEEKVTEWVHHLSRLSQIATKQPQDAYVAFTKSLSQEWSYLQRVVPECDSAFLPIEKAINDVFLPKLFGCEFSTDERQVFTLPVKYSGLGISDPAATSSRAYEVSRKATAHLASAIAGKNDFDVAMHQNSVRSARSEARVSRLQVAREKFDALIVSVGESARRCLGRAKEFSTGAWLSAYPSMKNDTVLSAQEFRDSLAIRYAKPLQQLPASCDGCGKGFSLDHGLNCPNGGNIIRRHNEIRDVAGQMASMVYSHVKSEPVVREQGCGGKDDNGLVCDLAVRGVWNPQTDVLLDFKIVNTDAQSYVNRPVKSVLESAAAAKKTKHKQACADRRADFTPFVCSTDGAIHREGQHFLKRLAASLSAKWAMHYSQTMSFVRTRMALAILRATVHCIRGARRKFFPLCPENGAAIALMS